MRVIHIQPIGSRAPAPPLERCPTSGKLRFASEQAAERTAVEWAYQNSWEGRAYECSECGGWHLTRSPERRAP